MLFFNCITVQLTIYFHIVTFYIFGYRCNIMAKMVVNRDKHNRVHIYLPAFIRDKFDLQNGDKVEVDINWNHIIITAR